MVNTSDFKKTRKWYRKETQNEVTYSPIRVNKVEYFAPVEYVNLDGVARPFTGKEIVDTINANNKCIYLGDNFYEREVEDSVDQELDSPPPGIYRYRHEGAEVLIPFEPRQEEEYIPLGNCFQELHQDIQDFLDGKEFYTSHKFLYKLGILMYSEPGMGKTLVLNHIVRTSLPPEALVIFMDGDFFSTEFMEAMKYSLRDILKVFVFEEFSTGMDSSQYVRRLLTFLDGEHSMPNTIVLATTNYPENIPGNLVDREQRFDKLIEFETPGADDRRILLQKFLGEEPTENMVKKTEKFSIAAIKDVVARMGLTKSSFEDTLKKIEARKRRVKKGFAKAKEVGFGSNDLY